MDFGTKLRQIRDKHGYSQEYVANKLGIEQTTYSGWERGKGKLKVESLPKLAEIYEMEMLELVKWLFEEGITFNNHNQRGGIANVLINNASEHIIKVLESENAHLKEEVLFLRKMWGDT